jgi:DNA-binding transcriptional MerR regulator
MPYKPHETEKVYWTIGEVSDMFGVNTSLIRFWEKEFDILHPHKNKKGNRMFTKEDVDNIRVIFHLVKERGYTLQGAREKLKQNKGDTDNTVEVVKSLKKIREFLVDLRKELTDEERIVKNDQ